MHGSVDPSNQCSTRHSKPDSFKVMRRQWIFTTFLFSKPRSSTRILTLSFPAGFRRQLLHIPCLTAFGGHRSAVPAMPYRVNQRPSKGCQIHGNGCHQVTRFKHHPLECGMNRVTSGMAEKKLISTLLSGVSGLCRRAWAVSPPEQSAYFQLL